LRPTVRRLAPLVLLAAVACGGGGAKSGHEGHDAAGGALTIDAAACSLSNEHLEAGKRSFAVRNGDGATVTFEADGAQLPAERSGDQITVDVPDGHLTVRCGGKSTDVHVVGATTEEKPSRDVEVTAVDLRFEGMDGFTAKTGETVRFSVRNNGGTTHEFDVLDADGTSLGGSGHLAAKKAGEAVVTFEKAGTYTYLCRVDSHDKAGMKGTFTVS
jgi:plastocyanin